MGWKVFMEEVLLGFLILSESKSFMCFNFFFNWVTNTYLVTALLIFGLIIFFIGAYYHKKSTQ